MIYAALVYMQVFAVILTSGHALLSTTFSSYLYILLFLSSGILLGYKLLFGQIQVSQKLITITILWLCFFLLLSVVHSDYRSGIKLVALITSCLITVICVDVKYMARATNNTILLIAVISMVTYVANNVFDVTITGGGFSNLHGSEYTGFWWNYVHTNFLRFRNIGVFWEPGLYANWLFLSLILMTYGLDRRAYIFHVLIILTMVTTFSFAGWCYLFIYFLIVNKSNNLRFFLALLACVIVFIYFKEVFMTGIDERLFSGKVSTTDRLDSYAELFRLHMDNSIIGVGYNGVIERFFEEAITTTAGTPFVIIASFGVFSLLVFYPLLHAIIFPKFHFLLLIALCIYLIKDNQMFFSVFHLLILYAINLPRSARKYV